MKKILPIAISCSLAFILASCSSSVDYKTLRTSSIDDDVKASLNIQFDETTNSKKLETEDQTGSYYTIYTNSDYKASLFMNTTCITEDDSVIVKTLSDPKRTKNVYVNALTFAGVTFYSGETSAILTEAYDSTYGITTLDLGFEQDTSSSWSKTLSTDYLINYINDNKEKIQNDEININVSTVYLPILATRTYKDSKTLKTYVFVPVYFTYSVSGQALVKSDNEAGYELTSMPSVAEKELTYSKESGQESYLATTFKTETTN